MNIKIISSTTSSNSIKVFADDVEIKYIKSVHINPIRVNEDITAYLEVYVDELDIHTEAVIQKDDAERMTIENAIKIVAETIPEGGENGEI